MYSLRLVCYALPIFLLHNTRGMLLSKCSSDAECNVVHSYCQSGLCICQPFYAQYNATCLPSRLLDEQCIIEEQCTMKVAQSTCSGGKCKCSNGFLQFRHHTCLSAAKPGDVCLNNEHCKLWSKKSYCFYLIPNLIGRCTCNAQTKLYGSICLTEEDAANSNKVRTTESFMEALPKEKNFTDDVDSNNGAENEGGFTEQNNEETPEYHFKIKNTSKKDPSITDPFYDQKKHYLEKNGSTTTEVVNIDIKDEDSAGNKDVHTEIIKQTHAEQIEQEIQQNFSNKSEENYRENIETTPNSVELVTLVAGQSNEDKTDILLKHGYFNITQANSMFVTLSQVVATHLRLKVTNAIAPTNKEEHIIPYFSDSLHTPNDKVHLKHWEKKSVVSLGLPCAFDKQCEAADPGSKCVNNLCECTVKGNETEQCLGCAPETFQCHSSGVCLSWFFVCDGKMDCSDGSDEECNRVPCPKHSFQCGEEGICVSRSTLCDGIRNCPNGEDELLCEGKEGNCPPHSFQCKNGRCLPEYEFCNAIPTCLDGSDEFEELCGFQFSEEGIKKVEDDCPFRCKNGRCRSTAIMCSGKDGCGDDSDEQHCAVCRCPPKA